MKRTRLEGLWYWARYQPDRDIDFNGFFWRHEDGGILIDPMPLADGELAQLEELGGVRRILVTNADHWRAAGELATRFAAEILAPAAERERLGENARRVGTWYAESSHLPSGIDVRWVRGGKSPLEPWFVLEPLDALLFADVVRSHVSGELRLLPAAKLADRDAVARDLEPLAELRPEAVLLGDGDCLFRGAAEELARFVNALREPAP